MPKPSPVHKPDPMSGVVDRLLAQLPGLQGEPPALGDTPPRSEDSGGHPVVYGSHGAEHSSQSFGVWGSGLLGLSLGGS